MLFLFLQIIHIDGAMSETISTAYTANSSLVPMGIHIQAHTVVTFHGEHTSTFVNNEPASTVLFDALSFATGRICKYNNKILLKIKTNIFT